MALALPHIKSLLESLRLNGWYITAFSMDDFYDHDYAVVFEDLRAIDKGSRYYAVELTFIDMADEERILSIRANAYGFNHVEDALLFFGIPSGGNGRHPEFAIYNVLNIACPETFMEHPEHLRDTIITAVDMRDQANGTGLCCYAARRNGLKPNGSPMHRTEFNTTKTKLLRPNLFNQLGLHDNTISFCYRPQNERTDAEIIHDFRS